MTVQELIDALQLVEDKTLPVYRDDYESIDCWPVSSVKVLSTMIILSDDIE